MSSRRQIPLPLNKLIPNNKEATLLVIMNVQSDLSSFGIATSALAIAIMQLD